MIHPRMAVKMAQAYLADMEVKNYGVFTGLRRVRRRSREERIIAALLDALVSQQEGLGSVQRRCGT